MSATPPFFGAFMDNGDGGQDVASLHDVLVEDHRNSPDGWHDEPPVRLTRASVETTGPVRVRVVFDDYRAEVQRFLNGADLVVGCVAWLTDLDILAMLATVPDVQFIVQKEDFLRPDLGYPGDRPWRSQLRKAYSALRCGYERLHFPQLCHMSTFSDPTMAPVRCAGLYNHDGRSAMPRMHHKFAVACRVRYEGEEHYYDSIRITPYAVWTGSFNWTRNGGASLENVVIVEDATVAQAFFDEWERCVAISEPLDWTAQWTAPEFRFGT